MSDLPFDDELAADAGKASSHGLIFGCVLDGQGGARPIDWPQASQWQTEGDGRTLWLHMDRTVDGVADWLHDVVKVPQSTVQQLVSNETRPRAFAEANTLVAILRGINLNPGAQPEDMVAMQIWADGNRVISLRRRRLQTPRDVLADLDSGKGPKTAGDLVVELAEQLAAKMNRSIVGMNEQIDRLEGAGDDLDINEKLDQIAQIRRNCLALKRFMSPQHEALVDIGRQAPTWMSESNRKHVRETIDRLRRYLDDLDVSKESALVLQDDLNNRAANRSNQTMYMLSIVAAIFLPLSFVTGLLGINVGGMPGVESHDAFWVTVGLLTVLFGIQVYLFRKLKWL